MIKDELVRKIQHVNVKRKQKPKTSYELIKKYVVKKYIKSVFDRKYNLRAGKNIDYYA